MKPVLGNRQVTAHVIANDFTMLNSDRASGRGEAPLIAGVNTDEHWKLVKMPQEFDSPDRNTRPRSASPQTATASRVKRQTDEEMQMITTKFSRQSLNQMKMNLQFNVE